MYLVKNAFLNVVRSKGRNILIGVIIGVITISACIALCIHKAGNSLVNTYKEANPLIVSFVMDTKSMRGQQKEASFTPITEEDIVSFANSSYVTGFYYTKEVTLSSDKIEPVTYDESITEPENDRPNMGKEDHRMNFGDFRLTGYSDPSYISQFLSGDKKMKEGTLFDVDNQDPVVVISEDLALLNNLKVGDMISFYSPNEEENKITLTVIGIYEDKTGMESDNFMYMNAMNTQNQLYTNMQTVNLFGSEMRQNINASYYLKSSDDVNAFEKEVREKGLSDTYVIQTNEEEALASLKPIQNLSSFSLTFLFVILLVGGIILGIVNMIQIRERKYEIGVLRAIGMSKKHVTMIFLFEIFLVAMISLVIGLLVGSVLSQPVTNHMLKNEIANYQEQASNQMSHFGPGNFKRPGMLMNVDYVEELTVQLDVTTSLLLLGVSVLLVLFSGMIAVMFINQYEPNKILQNRV